ncbi:hypothetical protein [Methylobacterium nodulans]|uniref:Uncharacterized protein n=1 Tax=Methylobacterium nodulans (strain LMG 21967 / CNCM I-2342 / ORS 2060) TaxID=460265 RepID=B8ICQ6_METNO|nr:hypothetical protein [Methylobacterium nodulans]ACL57467.1 hypothetical protein Mnod_2497 [Methylobacterium nodulans ORS 2060]
MRSRSIRLDFKGRMHAPSKPAKRAGKKLPARPEKRTGYFGFVTRGLERAAYHAERRAEVARIRAAREFERRMRAA